MATLKKLPFPILQLPVHLIYEIISRLPLKTIFSCKCVCRKFLDILKDPYFAKIHLIKAPSNSDTVIVQDLPSGYFRPYMLNLDDTPPKSSNSNDLHAYHQHFLSWQSRGLTERNVNCCFSKSSVNLIGSCNGFVCMYSPSSGKPAYCICNPLTGECTSIPFPTASSSSDYSYLNHSGFGFCPTTKQYKVIRFLSFTPSDPSMDSTRKTVAMVHTLGTNSWRNIGNAPSPKARGSFDSFLHGALHWITDSRSISDLIYSFDLEKEKFQAVPVPAHFSPEYVGKISWICVGVLGRCLCLCYIIGDAQFEVCVMKDYGVQQSWAKKFAIDIKFYCGLKVEDLQQPVKFLTNGELLLICKFNYLLSYSPHKKTFRDIKQLGNKKAEAIAHVPSFLSVENAVSRKDLKMEKIKLVRRMLV